MLNHHALVPQLHMNYELKCLQKVLLCVPTSLMCFVEEKDNTVQEILCVDSEQYQETSRGLHIVAHVHNARCHCVNTSSHFLVLWIFNTMSLLRSIVFLL